MNIWVEWFRQNEIKSEWIPSPTEINRRFFDKPQDAAVFAKRMGDKGYHATVKRDGAGA
jgi:hypothetical protein